MMTAIETVLRQPVAQAVGWALLQFVWQGAAVGVVTALALLALRRSAADVRYVVGAIGLALMLTLPVVTGMQTWQALRHQTTGLASIPAQQRPGNQRASDASLFRLKADATTPVSGNRADRRAAARGVEPWVSMLILAWLAGVTLLSLRLFTGWLWVQRMRTRGVAPADAAWQRMATRLSRQLHIGRMVTLFESTLVDVPTVIGWLEPVILLPVSALVGLAPQQLETILAHELAHIRRHDYLVNLLQTLVETLLFYHPAVWWVSRRIRIERENCCDDLAVTLCGDPVTYANALADLEELCAIGRDKPRFVVSALRRKDQDRIAMAATGGSLLQRVRRLLGAPASHTGRGPAWLAGGVALLLVGGIAVGADGLRHDQEPAQATTAGPAASQASPAVVATTPATSTSAVTSVAAHVAAVAAASTNATAATTPVAAIVASQDSQASQLGAQSALVQAQARLADMRTRYDIGAVTEREVQASEVALRAAEARLATVQSAVQNELALDRARSRLALARAQFDAGLVTELQVQAAAAALHAAELSLASAQTAANNGQALDRLAAVGNANLAALSAAQGRMSAALAAGSEAEQSVSQHVHDSTGNWIWSSNGEKLQVSYSGTFDFTDDDADIRQISPGGSIKISDGAWLGRHSVEIREHGGQLERRYYINGSERPFEPEGRQWLHDHLPKFVRNTGFGAPSRVARFLKSGGPSAVMAEIGRIDGTYVKGIYFRELFTQASLTGEQYRQAMGQAAREMHSSDYELATLLISIADRLPNDEPSRAGYFTAASGVSSDYELRRVYSTMLKKGPVSAPILAGILEHSNTIQSDYELSELLRQIVGQQPLDDKSRAFFFKAMSTMHSDYERHRVLSAAIQQGRDHATLEAALTQAAGITSDYEAATFLMEVLKQSGVEGSLRAPFFKMVNGLSSSYERGRVLQAVVRGTDVSPDTLRAALQAAKGMSGYELSQLLISVAGSHTLTGDLRDAYLDAADKLSGYEQGQVMTALVKSERRK